MFAVCNEADEQYLAMLVPELVDISAEDARLTRTILISWQRSLPCKRGIIALVCSLTDREFYFFDGDLVKRTLLYYVSFH